MNPRKTVVSHGYTRIYTDKDKNILYLKNIKRLLRFAILSVLSVANDVLVPACPRQEIIEKHAERILIF